MAKRRKKKTRREGAPGLHDPSRPQSRTRIRPAVERSSEAPRSAPAEGAPPTLPLDAPRLAAIEQRLKAWPSARVPLAERVHVNRNLRMDRVTAVGFDMDYTLAVYAGREIERLAYGMALERMIEAHGRPQWLRELRYRPELTIRGLVVDKKEGNVLKIDAHGHVARVFHGLRRLDKEERIRLYRSQKIRLSTERYEWIDTLFALPEGVLYQQLVEGYEARGEAFDPAAIYDEIRASIDSLHRDGSLKEVIKGDLPRYIERNPLLGPTLHRLRSGGKRIFLLTNSYWDYTEAVMEHLLDGLLPEYESWRSYFDAVVVGASKPGFFSEREPFLEVDPGNGEVATVPATELHRGRVYQGGNLAEFEAYTDWRGDRVLYVGDHIYGDMLRSKRSGMWRTAMIVAELEREILLLEERKEDWARLKYLEDLRDRLDDAISAQKGRVSALEKQGVAETFRAAKLELEGLRASLHEVLAGSEALSKALRDEANPYWGLIFKDGNENSRFGDQVRDYSCVYMSRVTDLRHYSPVQYFRAPWDSMPHEGL
ncbi:MAG: HAD-IG family 5'-nucleotidase [Deltaproteobacteria bacterium]|nr:HAD-IG family 5'-nucleotidase [Deltaproteobacteria bacterium]